MQVFGMNYFVFCIMMLFVVLYFTKDLRDEGFYGMSPGTMDQLASTRVSRFEEPFAQPIKASIDVNAKPNQEEEDLIQSKLTMKALLDMTESGNFESGFAKVSK